MKQGLLAPLRNARAFLIERYRRLGHARDIFKMRFIQLSVGTHIDLPETFVFDESKAKNRGRQAPDGKYYSSFYTLDWPSIPEAIKQDILKFDSVLRLYFGGDYLINTANVWRNVGIPDEYRSLDIYSQVWHYDHVVDYRNLQLFVLLTDTTDRHGPFEYLVDASETEVSAVAQARSGAEISNARIGKLTGVRGDGMLFSTGATPHRAGIPDYGNHRDIFSISFFPVYTGLGVSAKTLFADGAKA